MNTKLEKYLRTQIKLGKITLEEVLRKYPDFTLEDEEIQKQEDFEPIREEENEEINSTEEE